jgi:hypothetical protein
VKVYLEAPLSVAHITVDKQRKKIKKLEKIKELKELNIKNYFFDY